MALTDIETRVDEISKVSTGDNGVVTAATRTRCIGDALKRYNRDRPRRLIEVIAAVGGSTWEYSLSANISGWNPSQHAIEYIVYPAGRQVEERLDENDWQIRKKADGTYWLVFHRNNPASGADMWIHYTAPHELDADSDTVLSDYPNDWDAFCHLSAAYILDIAANNYADKKAGSTGSDLIDYGMKSDQATRRAREERAIYEAQVLPQRGGQSGFVDWDTTTQDGEDYLFWQGSQS